MFQGSPQINFQFSFFYCVFFNFCPRRKKKVAGFCTNKTRLYDFIRSLSHRQGIYMVPGALTKHTFSAFWLRSSVVSVLISLISGTSTKVDMMIKCLFEAFD